MKKTTIIAMMLLLFTAMASAQKKTIRVATDNLDLVMQVAPNGRLYQVYLGKPLIDAADYDNIKWNVYAASDGSVCTRGHEVYATSGSEEFFEPALAITHADGNMSTYLYYQSHEQRDVEGGKETIIRLADNKYPINVTLHYVAYTKQSVIKAWTEISHAEKQPICLWRYASAMLYMKPNTYYLTSYHSDWAREGQPAEEMLQPGKRVIDTKLGSRAAEMTAPYFQISIGNKATETDGEVIAALAQWPATLAQAGDLRAPHRIAHYLEDLAAAYHKWYNVERVVPMPLTDLEERKPEAEREALRIAKNPEPARAAARLKLNDAVRTVIAAGLDLLGVSAPEKM